MVGRAPGGNGCPVSVEVTALRWLRGHSWLNSWFHRARPPADSGPRCHHPPPRAPLETALACLGVLRVLRHVPSSEAKSPLSLSLSLSLVDGPLRWLESLPFVHEYLRPCFEHGLLAPSLVILSRELSSIIS